MHVGLDLLFVTGRAGGTETYVRELLTALRRLDPGLRFTGFCRPALQAAPPSWLAGVRLVPVDTALPGPLGWAAGEVVRLPRAVARAGVDVLHCPANFGPLTGEVPRVVTVHDLLHRRFPQLVPLPVRYGTRFLVDAAGRRADLVLTVSEASAADLQRYLGLPRERVVVTPPGAFHASSPGGGVEPEESVGPDARALLGLPDRPYVLSVGTGRPHKNLPRLVEALAILPAGGRPLLVLTGGGAQAELGPVARQHGVDGDVRYAGWVADDALEALYRGACAYVMPSLFEGFGLPVIEAMRRGVPVACSDIPVLREVAGDAAEYFDPMSAASIAAALRQVVDDPRLRGRLVEDGAARAAAYTWDRTAELTLAAYVRAARG
nr:glycosyltransferase family 1 protein [Motilibacter deserti]